MDKIDVTRVELITNNWRQYVNMSVETCEIDYQDWWKTLKIFVDWREPTTDGKI